MDFLCCQIKRLSIISAPYYDKASERGIRWDDPLIHIDWKISKPILSEKDRCLPLFHHLKKKIYFYETNYNGWSRVHWLKFNTSLT